MRGVFLKLYALLIAAGVISYLVQDYAMDRYWSSEQATWRHERMVSTHIVAEEALAVYPPERWPVEARLLGVRSKRDMEAVPIEVAIKRFNLAPDAAARLRAGDVSNAAWSDSNPSSMRVLPDRKQVLVISYPQPPRDRVTYHLINWIPQLIFFGVAIGLWIWPFSRDVRGLSLAAERLGSGDLDHRVVVGRSSALAIPARAFNTMSARITGLIRAQRELANAVAHELKTPLARLHFSLTMAQDGELDGERRATLERAQADVAELDLLVSEMLVYARMEREVPPLSFAPVDVIPWLKAVVAGEVTAAGGTRQVKVTWSTDVYDASFEPRHMARALSNVLRNALRYAKHRVEIGVERTPHCTRITVDDDGPGIPRESRALIFEPFARLDESRDRAAGGVGLGLAIARRVIEWHGGRVVADDSPLGGSRFVLAW